MADTLDFITFHNPSNITTEFAPATVPMVPSLASLQFQSEPVVRKLAGQQSCSNMPKKIWINPDLEGELANHILLDVPGLLQHLFSDSIFPIPFETLRETVYQESWTIALKSESQFSATLWAGDPEEWAIPRSPTSDLILALNKLSETIRRTVSEALPTWPQPSKRIWISEIQKRGRGKRANSKRLPDFCLVHANEEASMSWSSVLVPLEVKPNVTDCENAFRQLTNNAFEIFSNQEERRFVIGISICAVDVRAYVFDRAGVVGSGKFDLNYNPSLFIRLIGGLILADMDGIGLDSSIRLGQNGFRYVSVAWVEYQIIKQLFLNNSIRGRGTLCWHVQSGGQDYVIKDAWTEASKVQPEVDLLEAARGTDNVVQLVAQETVKIGEMEDSTQTIRSVIGDLNDYPNQDWYQNVEIRLHRRIVITPFAEPLTNFRSKRELLQVFIGVIEGDYICFLELYDLTVVRFRASLVSEKAHPSSGHQH